HFVNANVIHMGDTFFNGIFPFIDFASGGAIDGLIHAADRVLSMVNSNTQIIPGHGPLAKQDALLEYRNMLMTVRDGIRTMLNDGMSVDEIVAADPAAGFADSWTGNAERMVRNAALSLVGQ
ncbi:MAG: hypothetical protein IID06_09095, partial [Gemmatimonadetes bacterium]|nr:hypothetical protein [Gemmatimonadota bacterium]